MDSKSKKTVNSAAMNNLTPVDNISARSYKSNSYVPSQSSDQKPQNMPKQKTSKFFGKTRQNQVNHKDNEKRENFSEYNIFFSKTNFLTQSYIKQYRNLNRITPQHLMLLNHQGS